MNRKTQIKHRHRNRIRRQNLHAATRHLADLAAKTKNPYRAELFRRAQADTVALAESLPVYRKLRQYRG